jgi:hypothetical protein
VDNLTNAENIGDSINNITSVDTANPTVNLVANPAINPTVNPIVVDKNSPMSEYDHEARLEALRATALALPTTCKCSRTKCLKL